MSHYDVFNGDADGLCALQQLRLAQPRPAVLVTGVKRDVALLERTQAKSGDSLTVLDISMSVNEAALRRILDAGAEVQYFDHHHAPEHFAHPRLEAYIDTSPQVCTSILVDRFLGGRYRAWAVVGAFGDAMTASAETLAGSLGLAPEDLDRLRRLGGCLNYNAYGDSATDQMYAPATLHARMLAYPDPLRFIAEQPIFEQLERQYEADIAQALALRPLVDTGSAAVFELPDAPWSRRVVGNLANRLIATAPDRALAVLVPGQAGLTVSLRVPAKTPVSADRFARRFGGNGRQTAAGINGLGSDSVESFVQNFLATYPVPPVAC